MVVINCQQTVQKKEAGAGVADCVNAVFTSGRAKLLPRRLITSWVFFVHTVIPAEAGIPCVNLVPRLRGDDEKSEFLISKSTVFCFRALLQVTS
jgi:hypothetical protein